MDASGGGIVFMLYNGTVGYNWMTVPFTICGVLTFIYAVTAAYFAATHNLVRHRAWVIRAFFIGNASPLYQVTCHFIACGKVTCHFIACGKVTCHFIACGKVTFHGQSLRLALLPRTDGIG
jgi:hypothetical protein